MRVRKPGRSRKRNASPHPGRCSMDNIISLYKRDIDMTLLAENLKLTPTQRIQKLMNFLRLADELRRAGARARKGNRA